jgi:filamentous hemagglutinin
VEIKYTHQLTWDDLPGIEKPFFAMTKIANPLTGIASEHIGQIQGLGAILSEHDFLSGRFRPPEDESEDCFWLMEQLENGLLVIVHGRKHARDRPFSPVLYWRTEKCPEGFPVPSGGYSCPWPDGVPPDGRWIPDPGLPWGLRRRIEECLEEGRRDETRHRGVPEKYWWGLLLQGYRSDDDDAALDDTIPTNENLARKPPPKPEHSLGEKIIGAGEAALTMATGVVGMVMGSLDGVNTIVSNAVSGKSDPGDREAARRMEKTAEMFTYSPRTEAGRDAVRGVAKAMDAAKIAPYVPGLGTAGMAGRAGLAGMRGVKPKVTSKATVGEHVFYDTNPGARPAAVADASKPTLIAEKVAKKKVKPGERSPPNGNMADAHAEVGAIQQAHEAGVAKGADMVMKVDGLDVCDYCKSDIPAMAEKAGLNSLEITSTNNKGVVRHYHWQPGTKLVEIK